MSGLLVVRPEPGAAATAARAAAHGWDVAIAPIFTVRPIDWQPPSEEVDGVMFTSANAVRHAGPALDRYVKLPAHVVGAATRAAAREAGFTDVRIGGPDAATLVARLGDAGRVLHLAGREHREALPAGGLRRLVYASEAGGLPDAGRRAIADGAVVLIHSARAAGHLAALLGDIRQVRIGALSPAVAATVSGWGAVAVAARPDEDALLAAVAHWR